jgi:hypothetical protein
MKESSAACLIVRRTEAMPLGRQPECEAYMGMRESADLPFFFLMGFQGQEILTPVIPATWEA